MYLDPRKIVDRYLKKIASAEESRVNNGLMFIQRAIGQDMKRIKNSEAAIKFEKLERSYAAECLKRQLKNKFGFRLRRKSLAKSSSDKSIYSLQSHLGKKTSERVDRSIQVDTLSSLSKNQIKQEKLPKLNRQNFKKSDIDEVGENYGKGNASGKSQDYIRIKKGEKQKAMKDYYKSRVKVDFTPHISSSKHLEASLRAFSSEKQKNFKDFKIVRLFG